MRKELVALLIDPASGDPLALEEVTAGDEDEVEEGTLAGGAGRRYPVSGGIPRLVTELGEQQAQTRDSFAFKWAQKDSFGSPKWQEWYGRWLADKYGFGSTERMAALFGGRLTLDAGTGAGAASASWLAEVDERTSWVGVDISAAIDVARERLGGNPATQFVQADVMRLPFRQGTFDVVFSEGVLHHTPSTRQALESIVSVLRPGGDLLFYVYRRKAPIREFTDDYVRGIVSKLDPEDAWAALRPMTRLAQALAELEVQVEVPDRVSLLEIPAGRYDVQRLVYWHFAKLFWNPELTFEENNHVNFDWYHPRYAHRQTEDEVRAWCGQLGLEIRHFHVEEAGIAVRAVKS